MRNIKIILRKNYVFTTKNIRTDYGNFLIIEYREGKLNTKLFDAREGKPWMQRSTEFYPLLFLIFDVPPAILCCNLYSVLDNLHLIKKKL